jgi:hypothetical protein
LLLSVGQPSAGNVVASLDYQHMRMALNSGNLVAAQQAYLRLQSDLLLSSPAQAATANDAVHLNVTG